ncbi:RagB/SusD family nutrient uptake outer membrane protein [Polaribacter sargassicola]|uniref:RagB/SusD family nutrient uptake outer membrane protein n=1 Tax=Polaribacter sargassicola TaxID=2836891 RepID=UPI001F3437D4|nr:RagB/SusD family nutrient uptake outer membrane protein [Polaribacter sp. DS7-9]MCG1035816.1 RagB/SusD family nutrient uptake outer membrane protein [Polaribacter sp. DS7-9]
MKTKFYKIVMVFVLIGAISSCEDYLDINPDFGVSEEDIFSGFESTRGYLDNCYELLLDIHHWRSQRLNRTSINALSDEGGSPFNGNIATILNPGSWYNRWEGVSEIGWGAGVNYDQGTALANAQYSIRVTNKVLERVENDLVPNLTEEQKNQLLGQAYFFRAWYYFQMIQRGGGMPILDKAYSSDDDTDLYRVSYSESTEWLLTDLDKAIAILPDRWDNAEFGRVTKGAAMAVKSMATLYAASPLMQNNIQVTQYLDYSKEWSERAAEYAHDLIAYIDAGSGGAGFRLMNKDEYKNIFYTDGIQASPESLWFRLDAGKRSSQSRGLRCNYLPQYFSGGTGNDATAYSNPTQNIVDMYEVINGDEAYDIDDSRSGYDPQNPYANRDPRFYNNVIVPGEEWGVNASGSPIYQELYVDGRDYRIQTTSNYTRNRMLSGYMCKKYIWPEANNFTRLYDIYALNSIYIRVAQVYLDYAEAMNEAYGPNADPKGYGLTAVQAINIIRNRVGMPNVLSEYTTSASIFRDRIRKERAVELMWENHRWHDLRRWMIAEDVFKEPIRGVRAIPPAGHSSIADKSTLDFTYEYIDLTSEQRGFELRNYWYPLHQDDVQDLYNFQQNPGW